MLGRTGRIGWVGVEIFFVISGFILPYSLARRDYATRDFGSFFLRRIIRLEPPYVASLIICVVLALASTHLPNFHGDAVDVSARTAVLHVTYLAGLFHVRWWNPVYWTLALELQFYILIGLSFPLLERYASPFLTVAVIVAAAALVPNTLLVFHWLPAFGAGIVTYQCVGRMNRRRASHFLLALALLTAGMLLLYDPVTTSVVSATALVIAYTRINSRPLLYLGGISYSLYLLHVPIGGRVINFGVRMGVDGFAAVLFMFAAVAASIVAAHVLSRAIEVPSRRYAHMIGLRQDARRAQIPRA